MAALPFPPQSAPGGERLRAVLDSVFSRPDYNWQQPLDPFGPIRRAFAWVNRWLLTLRSEAPSLYWLRIPTQQIATIGDMPNDIAMFKNSGISIAMGQATEEVRSAATYTTSSSEEEGFAKAVEKFVLNHAS